MNIKHSVGLNLSTDGIPPRLHMVQGDANSRTIVATLWDGAQPYSIPAEAAIMVRFRKPDGTGGLYDTSESGQKVSYTGSIVTAPVATQMLAVAGDVFAEIDIFGGGAGAAAERLATFRFMVEVAPCVLPDAEIISSDYYNILASKVAEAVSAAERAEQAQSAAAASAKAAATSVEGAVKYNTPQTLTDEQKQQARDNIGAPAPYTAGENISISGSVIATKAFPCNPKILDNWYFGNPVDQRGGYIVPSGVNYFLPDQTQNFPYAGTTTQAYRVERIDTSGSAFIKVNDTEYFVPAGGGIVRGYTGLGYTIDRWIRRELSETTTLNEGHVSITGHGGNFDQMLGDDILRYLRGKEVTLSILARGNVAIIAEDFASSYSVAYLQSETFTVVSKTLTVRSDADRFVYHIQPQDGNSVDIVAVGLELGPQQTLAHQENGVWVLNEIPDYGEQLRRCQRYLFAANSDSYPYACVGSGYISSDGTEAIIIIPTPVSLEKLPVCEIKGVLRVDTSYGEIVTLTSAAIYNIGRGAVCIHGKFTGTATAKAPCYALLDTGDNLFLSADL